jgi:hypothetical protein
MVNSALTRWNSSQFHSTMYGSVIRFDHGVSVTSLEIGGHTI